jgi:hypothetical protein
MQVCALVLGACLVAVDDSAPSAANPTDQPKPNEEYANMVARVLQGDTSVDFRTFRIAGALRSGPHASRAEQAERAAFDNLLTYGNFQGALDSANRALDRNYASLMGHFDAMIACQALQKTEEAALHERLLNALIESIRTSGDGAGPQTAWFVVTIPEEYLFLNRVLGVTRKSQSLVNQGGHSYDRLEVIDSKTNETRYVWFNTDISLGIYGSTQDKVEPQSSVPVVVATAEVLNPPKIDGSVVRSGTAGTQIRVRNGSAVDFEHVVVGSKQYGDIKAGATTEYQAWESAYGYTSVSLLAGSRSMAIHPIDYVGEAHLGRGHFTYVLTIEKDRLMIRAEKSEFLPSLASIRTNGVFGFPQKDAMVACDQPNLRFSVWNNDEYLFAQAVLWTDDDPSLDKTADNRAVGDTSQVMLDLDADGKVTPGVDRDYSLNPWPSMQGLYYQTWVSLGATTTLQNDSKGRGTIRYMQTSDGKRVRVDTYLIPLAEINKHIGDKIQICYWGHSPKPRLTVDSAGVGRNGRDYNRFQIPRSRFHEYVLSKGEAIDFSKIPEGRDDVSSFEEGDYGPLYAELRRKAGAGAVDCGYVAVRRDRSAADMCSVEAFQGRKAFFVRYDVQGIDSRVSEGVVGTAKGEVYQYNYDSDPSGGRHVGERVTEKLCSNLKVVTVEGKQRIECK